MFKTMENLITFLEKINETNSSLEKQKQIELVSNNDFITKVIVYTYNPLMQFNVSSSNVKKFQKNKNYQKQSYKQKYKDMFSLFDDLTNRVITGNEALKTISEFIKDKPEPEKDVIFRILDKNLKIRVNASTINKVYKKTLIPTFDPVLANNYDPKFNKLDKNWYISQKLDGVRCLIHIDKKTGKVLPYSRNGKELYNLEKIIKFISLSIDNFKESVFLDGEVVYIQENGKENFTKTIEIVRSSKNKKENGNLFYKAFDIIPENEFFDGKGKTLFIERQKILCNIFKNNKRVLVVDQIQYTPEKFESMKEEVKEKEWEGLMLRVNKPYKGKRTRDLAKVKIFQDEEFIVKEIISNKMRFINEKSGLEEEIECLAAIVIETNGINVQVGSGFSVEERKEYHKNPEKIKNKKVTVKYFEKTPDGSLRFPIYKGIRDYE